jgi:hypothetical protein
MDQEQLVDASERRSDAFIGFLALAIAATPGEHAADITIRAMRVLERYPASHSRGLASARSSSRVRTRVRAELPRARYAATSTYASRFTHYA